MEKKIWETDNGVPYLKCSRTSEPLDSALSLHYDTIISENNSIYVHKHYMRLYNVICSNRKLKHIIIRLTIILLYG